MSQVDKQDPEKGPVMDEQNDSRPTGQNQQPKSDKVGDSSDPLFTMYSKYAEDEDKKMTERWKKDADGIIIFTGLFSSVLAALVAVSVQDLRPNSQDRSAFYLEKLYELQADPNLPRPSTPSAVATPPAFSPPQYAVWVNSLWFLSLVISLSCAMLATLLQQWSRRYLTITQPARCDIRKRARARAFFAIGVEKFHVSWVVDALPAMVHLSLFIFFAGLLVYLFNIHLTVFKVVVCWVALLTTVYGFITFMPFFWHDSPYYSPLSTIIWSLPGIIPYAVLKFAEIIARPLPFQISDSISELTDRCRDLAFFKGLEAAAEEARSKPKRLSEIDAHVLDWTANALDDDDALERFIKTIPGFYKSDEVKDIPESVEWSILGPLQKFLFRTLSLNSISSSVKTRRLALCFDTVDINKLRSDALEYMFKGLIHVNWSAADSVEIGYFLKSLEKRSKGRLTQTIPGIIAQIIASVREGDSEWTKLALDHLGILESILQGYLAQGDSLLLANLVHSVRQTDRSDIIAIDIVQALPKFDICNTLPELQHDFCDMWNQVVQEAQKDDDLYLLWILQEIRHHYIALHRGTDAAPTSFYEGTDPSDPILWESSSYPLCNLPGHRPHPMHDIHGLPVGEAAPPAATTSFSSSVPRHDIILTAISPSG